MRKAITAETKFVFCSEPNNGYGYLNPNKIGIGKNVFTIELLVHELGEVDLQYIFKRLGIKHNVWVRHKGLKTIKIKKDENGMFSYKCWVEIDSVSHLLSPFGDGSLISPVPDLTKGESLI